MGAEGNISGTRARLYARLNRRNRVVALLRFAVPGAGIALAGFLIFQIILSNLADNFGLGGIRVDRDQLVLDTPSYSGIMSDGTTYEVVAKAARASIDATDVINLDIATIVTEQTDGYTMTANADFARLFLTDQQVIVEGLMVTRDSNGVDGRLNDSVIDWPTQKLTTNGEVRFDFEDGAAIEAQSLVYNAKRKVWDFRGVRYTVPGDGGLQNE